MDKTSHPQDQTPGSEEIVSGECVTTIDQATPPENQAVASSSGGSTSIGFSEARIKTNSVRISFERHMSAKILQLMCSVEPKAGSISSEGPDGFKHLFLEYGPKSILGRMVGVSPQDEHRRFTLRAFIRGEQSPNVRAHTILSEYYKEKIRPPTTPKGAKTTWEGDKIQYLEVELDGDDNTEEVEIEREPSDYFETEMTRSRDGAIAWSSPFSCRIKWYSCRAIEGHPEWVHGRAYLQDISHQPDGWVPPITDDMAEELLLLPSRASIRAPPSHVDDDDEDADDCNSEGIQDDLPSLF